MKPITWRRVLITSLLCALAVPLVALAGPQVVNLKPGDDVRIRAQGCNLSVQSQSVGEVFVACVTAIMTPTATPQATSTATVTATIPPTSTVAATATLPPSDGVPACTDHDVTLWHGVVKRDSGGAILCSYAHEHHDDPRALDYAFGPLPYGEISYPWQTTGTLPGHEDDENHIKHEYYKWSTIDNAPCVNVSGSPYSFDKIRLETHSDAVFGYKTRFHSYFAQARACQPGNPSYQGFLQLGGWVDMGILLVPDTTQPYEVRHLPLPGDPAECATLTAACAGNTRRIHSANTATCPTCEEKYDYTWYGKFLQGFGQFGSRAEDWGVIDITQPSYPVSVRTFAYDGNPNNSWMEAVHLLGIDLTGQHDAYDGVMDGEVNWSGYVDRYGAQASGCTTPDLDCVPVRFERMKTGVTTQFRSDAVNMHVERQYDTSPSLIRLPN